MAAAKKKDPVIDIWQYDASSSRVRTLFTAIKKVIVDAPRRLIAGRSLRTRVIGAVLLAIIVGGTAFQIVQTFREKAGVPQSKTAAEDDGSIETYRVTMKEVTDEIEILGQIIFREKVNISSKVTGRLSKILVHEGARVTAGQLLAEIERLPLELTLKQQQSELDIAKKAYDLSRAKYENALKAIEIKLKTIEKAEADLNDKRVSYENMDRVLRNKQVLYKAGGLSESELKAAQTQHTTVYTRYQLAKSDLEIQFVGFRDEDITSEGLTVPKNKAERMELLKKINTKIERAELEAARSRIRQAEGNLESTQLLIKETWVRSPITGVVAAKSMEAGEMVKPDSVIATVMNIASVFLAMNVNEKDLKKIKNGQMVAFTVDALGEENFKAKIARITPVLDLKTRTVEIKAEIGNPGNRLLPGMFARAKIETGGREEKLVIPISSFINRNGNKGEIYVVKKGILFKQKVTTGSEYRDVVEVTSGVREDDIIISKGINVVYPGMTFAPKKSKG